MPSTSAEKHHPGSKLRLVLAVVARILLGVAALTIAVAFCRWVSNTHIEATKRLELDQRRLEFDRERASAQDAANRPPVVAANPSDDAGLLALLDAIDTPPPGSTPLTNQAKTAAPEAAERSLDTSKVVGLLTALGSMGKLSEKTAADIKAELLHAGGEITVEIAKKIIDKYIVTPPEHPPSPAAVVVVNGCCCPSTVNHPKAPTSSAHPESPAAKSPRHLEFRDCVREGLSVPAHQP